jgi:hypothetical protein
MDPIEEGGERANEIAGGILEKMRGHFLDLYGALEQEPNTKLLSRYDRDIQAGGRAAARALKKAIAWPANRAAAEGGAAGGFAFVPPYGTAASLSLVAAATLPLLRHCVEAHDVIAHASGRELREPVHRRTARLLVITATLPPKWRPGAAVWDIGANQGAADTIHHWDMADCQRAWDEREAAVRQWVIGWTVPRSTSALPFGIGAFAGAWTGYTPVKSTVRAAERFYRSARPVELEDHATDELGD